MYQTSDMLRKACKFHRCPVVVILQASDIVKEKQITTENLLSASLYTTFWTIFFKGHLCSFSILYSCII